MKTYVPITYIQCWNLITFPKNEGMICNTICRNLCLVYVRNRDFVCYQHCWSKGQPLSKSNFILAYPNREIKNIGKFIMAKGNEKNGENKG